jgi:hypothetical protein
MMPKARVLVQHGGQPGWLEKSDPADFVRDGRAVPPSFSVQLSSLLIFAAVTINVFSYHHY